VATAVTFVEVDTQPDGQLHVRWQLQGDPVAVDVARGPTPNRLDHEHATTVAAGRTTVQLPGAGGARQFVSVAPHGGGPAVVASDRRVLFEGVTNFRDLGGYRTATGDSVRWGCVFRADSLQGLGPRDIERYEQLGLRTVFDLRSDAEREQHPDPVPSRPFPISGRRAEAGAAPVSMVDLTADDGQRILRDLYVGLIEHAAVQIGDLFTGLVADGGLPAVFHCHAGKDRTGVVAAVLLEALGVDRGAILDDYELTARYRLRVQQESSYQALLNSGLSPEAAAGVLTTPRWAMQEALEDLDERHNGIEAYLLGPAAMTRPDLETLRTRLLDAHPDTAG
jgi:protein-tyrosine phosphatase